MNTHVLPDIIPLVIAASASPTAVTLGILILSGKQNPQGKALAYLIGNLLVLIMVGLAFLFLVHSVSEVRQTPAAWDSIIDLVVGAVLLYLGWSTYQKKPSGKQPKWLQGLETMSLRRSFLIGVGIMAINVSTLVTFIPAVRDITKLGLQTGGELIALAIIILLVEFWILLPLIITKIAPQKSAGILAAFMGLLTRHAHTVTIWMCLVFGAYFALKGAFELI